MLQSIMGYGYPPLWTDRLMDGQTRVKTCTFPRTTYAGGNNYKKLACWIVKVKKEDNDVEEYPRVMLAAHLKRNLLTSSALKLGSV